jgi:hypothetical protein
LSTHKPPDNDKRSTPAPQLQIQLDEAIAQGTYVNLTLVNHTETEFVLDFIFVPPMDPRAKVRARIISSPKHAKRFLMALGENVTKFEQRFGAIDIANEPAPVH